MTKRKPLQWITTEYGEIPGCDFCFEWLSGPGMAEAVASVSIERPVDVHRMVEQYHANRHVEG